MIPRVSAIVSTYNSERFFRGCIENLLKQTILDEIEIIVVDSASEENEGKIISEYLPNFPQISHIRSPVKSLYGSWNRAIQIARGDYLINANADDRSRPDAFEKMADILDAEPEIALVYSHGYLTGVANEEFNLDTVTPDHWEQMIAPSYSHRDLLIRCFIGPRPMWRKSLHNQFGMFDSSYIYAGDYEFWLRIAEKYKFFCTPEYLFLYYYTLDGLYLKNRSVHKEEMRLKQKCFISSAAK